jgi:hypothetical protein
MRKRRKTKEKRKKILAEKDENQRGRGRRANERMEKRAYHEIIDISFQIFECF